MPVYRTGIMTGTHTNLIMVGIDTGGTFTDLVARAPDGELLHLKVPSRPDDPSQAIAAALSGLAERSSSEAPIALHHGSTVATNAVLERKGARVALVTNTGLRDVLTIGRQCRPNLYALHPQKTPPLISANDVFGVTGRQAADGGLIQPFEDAQEWVQTHAAALESFEAIAIAFAHSYQDGRHEDAFADAIKARLKATPVSVSHRIAPVLREYERTSTAVVNAYVSPIMSRYLDRLMSSIIHRAQAGSQVDMMGSGGSLMPIDKARDEPVHTVLSGPAGGVRGAWALAQSLGIDGILTVDMGGTSTDIAVIDRALAPEEDGAIGPFPIRVPL